MVRAVRIGSSNPNCSAVSHSLWHVEFLSLSHSVEVGGTKWPDLLHRPNKGNRGVWGVGGGSSFFLCFLFYVDSITFN